MLVRRISKHVKEQNWFAVWLDLAMVVLGVFIGLQVHNWNEARIAQQTGRDYYARLVEDLRAEESTRVARIAYYQLTKQHGLAALSALEQADETLGEQFLVDAYQATQIWNYTPHRTTYDELLSVGITNAISNVAFRNRLANYYIGLDNARAILQERTPFRDSLRRHMPYSVQSAIRDKCGDVYNIQSDNTVQLTLPESCDVGLAPPVISEAISALRSYFEMEKDITRHLGDLDIKLQSLSADLSATRETLAYLEEISQ